MLGACVNCGYGDLPRDPDVFGKADRGFCKRLAEIEEAFAVYPEMNDKTVVSFPLRLTEQVQILREIVDSGKIGTVEHVQAVNDVPYGRVYFHGWYRDEKETGGLWLQKATHDFDYINSILRSRPVEICAMTSKQIFKGDKPAGKLCDECEEKQTCPESYISTHRAGEYLYGPWCCFAEDTGNEDSGSAIIRYETGMHVVYSQNFFARRGAGLRGARFLGYDGTAEFDFQSGDVVFTCIMYAGQKRIILTQRTGTAAVTRRCAGILPTWSQDVPAPVRRCGTGSSV